MKYILIGILFGMLFATTGIIMEKIIGVTHWVIYGNVFFFMGASYVFVLGE